MLINKKILIYLFFILTLFIGFYYGENSSGGAKIDFGILFPYIQNFSNDFKIGFETYANNSSTLLHSPIFYIVASLLLKLFDKLIYVNIIYIFISASLPYFLYQIIKHNYNLNNDYVFYLSLIIFFSPYFRSSSIWLLGDNLSLIFFALSIFFFIKSLQSKNEVSSFFFCLFFLILCCYIRYYYALFSIYYLSVFYKNLNKKHFFYLILFSFFLSIPAITYFYFIFKNYNFLGTVNNFGKINLYSNGLIILSMFLFYLIPLTFNDKLLVLKHFKKKKIYFFFIFFSLISIYILDYFSLIKIIEFSPRGGGVFLKLIQYLNLDEKLFLSIIAFPSIILLDYLFQGKRLINYSIFLILLLSLPLFTLYQKYIDPLIFLIIFGLIQSSALKEIIHLKRIEIKFYFMYFFSFYLFSLTYYLKIY